MAAKDGNAPGRGPAGREGNDRPTARIVARELSNEAVRYEAEQLEAFARRGGSVSRWLDSKAFAPADRAAILLTYSDLEAEP